MFKTTTENPIDFLKGRVFEVSLADLNKNEADGHVKFRLRADEIQGKNVLTNFHGLSFTSDRMKSLVRKWQSTISADVLVKTTDDYLLRLFVIAFTKRNQNQKKKTSYAQSAQIHDIRKKINQIVTKEVSVGSLKELVTKLIPNTIGQRIEKQASWIYPLKDVFVYKVKIVNAPKYDSAALLDLYGDNILDAGAAVARPAAAAAAPAAEASA